MTEPELQGRRVLVVGAGTRRTDDPAPPIGNGRAIAVLAARAGATVACADLDPDAAQVTADLVRTEGSVAHALAANVADAPACETLVAEAEAAMGGLDGLVCNVGIGAGSGLGGTTAKQWDLVFSVNVRSHFLLAAAALPRMRAGSSIVFVSSIAALMAGSECPAYDASKAALSGLCRHVAAEGGPKGVRANVVLPGLIDTPLGRLAGQTRPNRATTRIPLGRQGSAWEVAEAVGFLLSDRASYITGQTLAVDGGVSCSAS